MARRWTDTVGGLMRFGGAEAQAASNRTELRANNRIERMAFHSNGGSNGKCSDPVSNVP